MANMVLQAQHAQAAQLLQDLLDDCSRAAGPDLAGHSRDHDEVGGAGESSRVSTSRQCTNSRPRRKKVRYHNHEAELRPKIKILEVEIEELPVSVTMTTDALSSLVQLSFSKQVFNTDLMFAQFTQTY
jgi:hypothetical protein